MAGSQASVEAVYLRALMTDLGQRIDYPIDLYLDNKGSLDLAQDYKVTNATKHIERRHFKIRELVKDAAIRVKYVASRDNVADIFTKPLDNADFFKHRAKLLNLVRAE